MGRLAARDGATRQQRTLPNAPNAADYSEALARGLAVLAAFGTGRQRLTQADLARRLDLPRATVRRAVLTLEHLGYLVADGRSYELSPRILRLAEGYLTSNVVSTVVQPACERICAQLQESCSVAVLDGPDAVMIARAVPHRLIAVGSGIGYRVPALTSSLGKVLLAHLDPGELAARRADLGDLGRPDSQDDVERIRADGYCHVINDVEAGFQSIAVPLRRWDGRVVAAMNLGCSIERLAPDVMRGDVLDVLCACADELRSQLV